jgi:Uma2 family endonuclease
MTGVTATAVVYPSSDGVPMAETTVHVAAIMLLHQALEDFFHGRADVFIASDLFWYFRQGDNTACVAADVMVCRRPAGHRETYRQWEEGGVPPAVVFEMASENTWRNDLGDKFTQYESLGVAEYVIFDPTAEFLPTPLQVYRLNGTAYLRVRQAEPESALGFRMRAEGAMLRLIDATTGTPIPTRAERADAAERRVAELQAEIDRLRAALGGAAP